MTRRWIGAVVLVLVAAACNGDDDDAVETSAPETSAPVTTEPPVTTAAPRPETTESTTSTTAEATTTTVDVEALKAEIAEDFLRLQQSLEDLSRNPEVTDLEAAVSEIAVSGSPAYQAIVGSIRDRLATGDRIVAGDPDYSDVFVELVELDSSGQRADVTACVVTNELRLDATGQPTTSGDVLAARVRQTVEATSAGWLLWSNQTGIDIERGATSCPA